MNKNILFLINGLGIQTRDSYDIEINKCMPFLSELTEKQLFATLKSNTFDYEEGYAYLSLGSKLPLSFITLDRETEFEQELNNDLLNNIIINNKLHILCYYDDYKTYSHLKSYVKSIKKKTDKPIFIHLILSNKTIESYQEIEKFITKIGYDLVGIAKIGFVVGENYFNSLQVKELARICYTEIAEIWKEISIKINSLVTNKILPCDCKPFIINSGLKFMENDTLFVFNYKNVDLSRQMEYFRFNPITQQNILLTYYSLFPITPLVPAVHNYTESEISFKNNLKLIDKKCLVLCPKEQINNINYYLNGYSNTVSEYISFAVLDDNVEKFITNTEYDLYIINYDVSSIDDYNAFITELNRIDNKLKNIFTICNDNKYPLYISSLFGINKKIYDGKLSRYINFSVKLPFILIDEKYPYTEYLIKDGDTYGLINTLFKSMNQSFPMDNLVVKKTKLFRLFGR